MAGWTAKAVEEMMVSLFLQESDRDKQRKVGASQISDPCTRHLAHALVRTERPAQKYWLGAKIGTAIHAFIESAIDNSSDTRLAGAIVERKIELGDVPGYGSISSSPDLVLAGSGLLVDHKSSTRAKVKKVRDHVDGIKLSPETEYTLQKYLGQMNLYAWGRNKNHGDNIDQLAINFVNRDGTNEKDFYCLLVDYDEEFALALWNRLLTLWQELEDGAHPDNYPSHPECYNCKMGA
jgi:hypothetical protein